LLPLLPLFSFFSLLFCRFPQPIFVALSFPFLSGRVAS
jgi:hypothetical protein